MNGPLSWKPRETCARKTWRWRFPGRYARWRVKLRGHCGEPNRETEFRERAENTLRFCGPAAEPEERDGTDERQPPCPCRGLGHSGDAIGLIQPGNQRGVNRRA